MTRAITASELVLLRNQPSVVFTARINQTVFGSDIVELTYDGGVGTYGDIKAGMLCWVGTSAGTHDKGIAVIRTAATALLIKINTENDIAFAEDDYLTIYTQPRQSSKLYMAGTETPATVFACLINQTFSTTDNIAQLTYDNVTTGAYTDIVVGMTVWIGTSAGLYDIGVARIRKTPTSSILYINETSEIDFDNNYYVTVINEMGLWAKVPRTISGVLAMDYDITYDTVTAKQNEQFPPSVCMGGNAVIDVDSYPVTLTFPEAATYSKVFGSTITAWLWTATGGVLTNETTNNPTLTISSYPTNGVIRVAAQVTSAQSIAHTGYRYVRVYDSTHRPVTKFTLDSCDGSFDDGGWSFSVTMYDEAAKTEIRDRCPITVYAEDYYGATQVSIGQDVGRENIVCTGWVEGESISYDSESSTVSFNVYGAQYWLKKMAAFPMVYSVAVKTPTIWTNIPGLTVDKALFHLLHWRSTATSIMDVVYTDDTRYTVKTDTMSSDLWGQIVDIGYKRIFAMPGVDPLGRMWIKTEPQMIFEADRSYTSVMAITDADRADGNSIKRRIVNEAANISLTSKKVSVNGSSVSFYSLSSGHIYKRYGSVEAVDGYLATTQAKSNELCGLYAGWRNNEFMPLNITLAQNNRMFPIFPPCQVTMPIVAGDNERGISFSGNFYLRGASYNYDNENGFFTTGLTLERETFAELAVTGDVPGGQNTSSKPPEIDTPSLPPFPPLVLPPTTVNANHPTTAVIVSDNYGVLYTETFNETEPEWLTMNEGLTQSEYETIGKLVACPNGALFIMCDGDQSNGYSKIYFTSELGGAWTLVSESDSPLTTSYGVFRALCANPIKEEEVAVLGGLQASNDSAYPEIGSFFLGDRNGIGGTVTQLVWSKTYSYSSIVWTQSGWYLFTQRPDGIGGSLTKGTLYIYDASGILIDSGSPSEQGGYDIGLTTSNSKLFSAGFGSLAQALYWTDNVLYTQYGIYVGTAKTLYSGINPTHVQAVSASPVGQKIMASDYSGATYVAYRSSDGGATWSSMGAIIPAGMTVFENCGDDNRWIYGGGTNMKFTVDFGANGSNYDKEGNLTYIAPLINITEIRFIE